MGPVPCWHTHACDISRLARSGGSSHGCVQGGVESFLRSASLPAAVLRILLILLIVVLHQRAVMISRVLD